MKRDTRICSFDIRNIYPNIPTLELTSIIKDMANKNNILIELKNEMLMLTELTTKQNYFEINSKFYVQSEGLAMGAPSSAIFSETYLQYIEHNHIIDLLIKHQIILYHRYVDILVVYNTQHTNIDSALTDFNNIHRKIQFSVEEECNNQKNFLDLSIVRTCNKLEFGIFRKPTATDIMIHNRSCHPKEHKLSGINYLINRITSYPITRNNTIKEEQTMSPIEGQRVSIHKYQNTNKTQTITYKRKQQHRIE
jgi:hypothetical protein